MIRYKGAMYRPADRQQSEHRRETALGGFQIEVYKDEFCSYRCQYLTVGNGQVHCSLLYGHYNCFLVVSFDEENGHEHPVRCEACLKYERP